MALTSATAVAAEGILVEPHQVAGRAGRAASELRGVVVITQLLAGESEPWGLQRIGAAGLELLSTTTGPSADELRKRLLERGFCEARTP